MKPFAQVAPQAPLSQVATMFGPGTGHTLQATPQYCGLMSPWQVSPQACVPLLHVNLHAPLTQAAVAEARSHFVPQRPQFWMVSNVTQEPLHSCWTPGQLPTQLALPSVATEQSGVVPPQFVEQFPHVSLAPSEASHPFAGLPSQLSKPGLQLS
jgi:hypothetical protein